MWVADVRVFYGPKLRRFPDELASLRVYTSEPEESLRQFRERMEAEADQTAFAVGTGDSYTTKVKIGKSALSS